VRAVKVLLAGLRSTLTVLPSPGRGRVWIHAEDCRALNGYSTQTTDYQREAVADAGEIREAAERVARQRDRPQIERVRICLHVIGKIEPAEHLLNRQRRLLPSACCGQMTSALTKATIATKATSTAITVMESIMPSFAPTSRALGVANRSLFATALWVRWFREWNGAMRHWGRLHN